MRSVRWRRAAILFLALGVGCLLTGAADGRGPPKTFHITFLVRVLGGQDNGSVKPLRGATVSGRPGSVETTNAAGYALVEAAESITVGETPSTESRTSTPSTRAAPRRSQSTRWRSWLAPCPTAL